MTKSLLRYPGGKTAFLKQILPFFEGCTEVFSPFFGGGVVELNLEKMNKKIYGNDIFKQLVSFWNIAMNEKERLYEEVKKHWLFFHNEEITDNEKRDYYYDLKKSCLENQTNTITAAANFFVVNRISYSALTLLGGFSKSNIKMEFGKGILERLQNFKVTNLVVECNDFEESFNKYGHMTIYADPPYYLNRGWLYGEDGSIHRDFNHERLKEQLTSRSNWVLSYNNCDQVKELYNGYRMIALKGKWGMTKHKVSKELLILGDGIKWSEPEKLFKN